MGPSRPGFDGMDEDQGGGEPEVMGASPVDSRRFESAEIVESIEVVPSERPGPQRK